MIVLGLGGNVGGDGDILERFDAVARAFGTWGTVHASRVYRTAPIGPEQPAFLNAALAVWPEIEPSEDEVLEMVIDTERVLGRDRAREQRWGPRTIDIDVLLWDDLRIRREGLIIPHPRLGERRFVLEPLADLVGDERRIPGLDRTIGELRAAVADQDVRDTEYAINV
jgi:2-amino-4-hydroxy-6-hydroxymethyldihydropteridine diphosphokinase